MHSPFTLFVRPRRVPRTDVHSVISAVLHIHKIFVGDGASAAAALAPNGYKVYPMLDHGAAKRIRVEGPMGSYIMDTSEGQNVTTHRVANAWGQRHNVGVVRVQSKGNVALGQSDEVRYIELDPTRAVYRDPFEWSIFIAMRGRQVGFSATWFARRSELVICFSDSSLPGLTAKLVCMPISMRSTK